MLFVENDPFIADTAAVDGCDSIFNNVRWFGIYKVWVAGCSKGDGDNPVKRGRGVTTVDVEAMLELIRTC